MRILRKIERGVSLIYYNISFGQAKILQYYKGFWTANLPKSVKSATKIYIFGESKKKNLKTEEFDKKGL